MTLIMANYKDQIWNGIEIKRGQFLTSRKAFAKECHTTQQQVRDFWDKLTEVGFLKTQRTNKYTIVTICNYDRYQRLDSYFNEERTNREPAEFVLKKTGVLKKEPADFKANSKQSDYQKEPTENKQRTTTKEHIKKEKEVNTDFQEVFKINPATVIKTID